MRATWSTVGIIGALATGSALFSPPVAWARGEQTGYCNIWLDSRSPDCKWTASGNQTWLTIENDIDRDINCVAEAIYHYNWDDASASIGKGNTATLVLKRDPKSTDTYEVTCTSADTNAEGDHTFTVWAD